MREPFIVNVADAPAYRHPAAGAVVMFEQLNRPFPEVGINIRILQAGESNAYYHSENQQEDFLVLGGRCMLVLDGEEHELHTWDFVHCPAGARHAFVGAGDGPCWILMIGARRPDERIEYPVDATAAKHSASVAEPTRDPDVVRGPAGCLGARPPAVAANLSMTSKAVHSFDTPTGNSSPPSRCVLAAVSRAEPLAPHPSLWAGTARAGSDRPGHRNAVSHSAGRSRSPRADVLKYERVDGVDAALQALAADLFPDGHQQKRGARRLRRTGAGDLGRAGPVPVAHADAAPDGADTQVLAGAGRSPQLESAGEFNRIVDGLLVGVK